MSYFKLACWVIFLSLNGSVVFASEATNAEACDRLLINKQSIPVTLHSLLGDWDSCETTLFKKYDYGIDQTLSVKWKEVTLIIKYQAPETGIYIVEVKKPNVLTAEWFEMARGALIPSFFDINWDIDMFPGPTSEHFAAKDEGTNGQVWIERDSGGAISWMRFSYAL